MQVPARFKSGQNTANNLFCYQYDSAISVTIQNVVLCFGEKNIKFSKLFIQLGLKYRYLKHFRR